MSFEAAKASRTVQSKGPKRDYTKDYQDRPARKQVEYSQSQSVENAGTYNIWYSKWSGDGSKFGKGTEKATTRCVLARDAGRTKAGKKSMFCVHFARGCCSKGKDCTFLHRIPMAGDRSETTVDIFGRDKHRVDREDMGGIGSFERLNTTLYVGHVSIGDDMEVRVRKHFSEWGEIDRINILYDKGVAFVQYKTISSAEFAKEAMYGQTLDSGEVLNVRWATEDPNPGIIAKNKRKAERIVEEAIKAKLPVIGQEGTIADYEKSFKHQRLDANAPTSGQVAHQQQQQALQIQGAGPMYTNDAMAAYYSYYAQYGYVPAADGKSFVYDPTRAAGVYGAVYPGMAYPAPAPLPAGPPVHESASSAYAIPLPKTASAAVAAPSNGTSEATKQDSPPAKTAAAGAEAASTSNNSSNSKPHTPAAAPAAASALVSGYGSSGDDDDDEE